MTARRLAALASMVTIAFAGCGGDESSADRPAAAPSTQTTGDTQAKTPGTTEAARHKEKGSQRRPPEETDSAQPDKKGKKDSGPRRDPSPPRPKPSDSRDAAGDKLVVTGARPPVTGRALNRCMRRSLREKGQRRLRIQARCLSTTAGKLRSLIVANCRKATRSRAAERRCIRASTGE